MNDLNFVSLISTGPFLVLALGILFALLSDLFGWIKNELVGTLLGLTVIFGAYIMLAPFELLEGVTLSGQISSDKFASFFSRIILLAAGAVLLLNYGSLEKQRISARRDINPLILLSTTGALGLVSSNDLISMFLSLELLSIPVYVLVGSPRGERAASEGALKYFILGALCSAFFLYGMALLYGVTGTLQISELANVLRGNLTLHPVVLTSVALMLLGFAFKVSLAPFAFWTPDAYQGAPLSVLGYMAVVVKAAAIGAFVRVFGIAFGGFASEWAGFVLLLACLSMLVGNLAAMRQRSMKRLLAYSSIAHAGYAISALPFVDSGGLEAVLLYTAAYAVTSMGMVAVLLSDAVGTENQFDKDSITSLKGLSKRDPIAAYCLAIFILSLAGLPPLAGFYGKFFIIMATLKAGFRGVAVLLVLNSALSLFYYLKVIAVSFESGEERESQALISAKFITFASALAVLVATVFVDPISFTSREAVKSAKSSRPLLAE